MKLEFARAVVYAAVAHVGDLGARSLAAVSHAKLAATDAAEPGRAHAIQVHGAMGYSWEVDLHFYMKRAWALAGAWGDRSFHVPLHPDAGLRGSFPARARPDIRTNCLEDPPMSNEAYIIGAVRSPTGKKKGTLRGHPCRGPGRTRRSRR